MKSVIIIGMMLLMFKLTYSQQTFNFTTMVVASNGQIIKDEFMRIDVKIYQITNGEKNVIYQERQDSVYVDQKGILNVVIGNGFNKVGDIPVKSKVNLSNHLLQIIYNSGMLYTPISSAMYP